MSSDGHQLWADRPITKPEEDLLGRTPFANALANAIRSWRGTESIVFALYGSWGSGKSSVKNLTLHALGSDANAPLIVEFNPWQWSSQDQLFNAFFRALAEPLARPDAAAQAHKLAAKWKAYAAYLTFAASIPDLLKQVFQGLTVALFLVGIGGLSILNKQTVAIVLLVLAGLSALLAMSSRAAGLLSDALEARGKVKEQSLAALRTDLTEALVKLNKPILVVIDDIDRLTPRATREVMQLVKSNADFPGVIYLLLFQRDVVERALDEASESGANYLAKIVQVGYDIPSADATPLERLLLAEIERALGFEEASRKLSVKRWAAIYPDGIRPYFRTVRDIRRFMPTLQFHAGLFRTNGTFAVNPVDLIALETLRAFEPRVYHQLTRHKAALTGASEAEDEGTRNIVSELIKGTNREGPLIAILSNLFPRVGQAWNRTSDADDDSTWYRQMRACHSGIFDRYFVLDIPEGDVSPADLERILARSGNQQELAKAFDDLRERGILPAALNRLEHYKTVFPRENASNVVAVMFDLGDDLPESPSFVGGFWDAADHARRIAYWVLRGQPDGITRAATLRQALSQSRGLAIPVVHLSGYDRDINKERHDDDALPDVELDSLRKTVLERIRDQAASGQLAGIRDLGYVLGRWSAWGDEAEPREWVLGQIQTPIAAAGFLGRMTGRQFGPHRVRHFVELGTLEKYIALAELETRLEGSDEAVLDQRARDAIKSFRYAMQRRKAGLGDDIRHGEFDEDDEAVSGPN